MAIRDNLGGGSSGAVLDTLEEISANTESGKAAGALAVKELNNSLTWKLVGTVTGSTPISFPSDFNELHIMVSADNSGAIRAYATSVLKDNLSDSGHALMFGYGYSNKNSYVHVQITKETAYINGFLDMSKDVLQNATLTVHYR